MDDRQVDSEFEHGHADYDDAEMLEHARGIAQGFVLATLAHLVAQGLSIEEWATAVGQRFVSTWGEPRQWDAGEYLDAMLTNYRSLGATVVEADLQPEHAAATITSFPDDELCRHFQVTLEMADHVHAIPAVISEGRRVTWSWRREDDLIRFRVDRQDPG